MTQAVPTIPGLTETGGSSSVSADSAVARCSGAWLRVYKEQVAKGKTCPHMDAAKAYRSAMPLLSGHENIRDFVACVAHGVLFGSIDESQSSKLLYAAQVALSTMRSQPSPRKSGAVNSRAEVRHFRPGTSPTFFVY